MALKSVKGTFERMLDKNLQDLVRGIRNHKEDEVKYIAQCLDEIKIELKLDNLASKANAINKLIYLQMLGNEINWAAFNIIEVMSSTKFTYKRIGYLAASQSFHEQTDVLMLTTNLIRKDLNSPNYYETGVALSGLSCFLTPDLARDLAGDLMTLMTSTKPYIRKKAVLLMYKVFLKFPDALRPAFPRLKEKLEDPDPGVQSAAVNVICELARKNPKNYLSLAPVFFKLMNSSNNNWVLIKIIKLFGALTPLEPRLGKKLIEPLTNLIHSTSAMSLLYECINTVIAGIPNHSASIQLCVQKLRILIEDSDQNLKYLGLLAMTKILKSHPKSVQTHKDLILNCLDDKDESIRLRALDLLYGMISKKNIMEIVKKLMTHMDKAEGSHYRDELLVKIIEITSQNNYQYITNFEWYVTVLGELTRIEGIKNGELIATQLLDVAIRVPTVREFTVQQMANLLQNSNKILFNAKQSGVCEVVYAAAWICGEYAEYLLSPTQTLEQMLHPSINALPGHIQSILVQNTLKLYCHLLSKFELESQTIMSTEGDVAPLLVQSIELTQLILEKMAMLVHSSDLEVQERAVSSHQLLRYVLKQQQKNILCGAEVGSLFGGEINPVTNKAQSKVPIPEGLDLDCWINEPLAPITNDILESDDDESVSSNKTGHKKKGKKHEKSIRTKSSGLFTISDNVNDKVDRVELTEEELEQIRNMRLREQEANPHYLKDMSLESTDGYINLGASDELPPLEPIENIIGANQLNKLMKSAKMFPSSESYLQQEKLKQENERKKLDKKRKRSKRNKNPDNINRDDVAEEDVIRHVVKSEFDAPEGVEHGNSEQDNDTVDLTDPHRLLNIDLDRPLTEADKFPIQTHRVGTSSKHPINISMVEIKVQKHKNKKERSKKHRNEKRAENDLNEENKKSPIKEKNKKVNSQKTKERNEEDVVIKENVEFPKSSEDPNSLNNDKPLKERSKKNKAFSNLTSLIKIDKKEFANILSSGSLQNKSTVKVKDIRVTNFHSCVKVISKKSGLFVVEEIQNTASLYGRDFDGSHVCLLIKMITVEGSCLSIEGKSDSEGLVESVTKAIKHLVRGEYPATVLEEGLV